MAYSALTANNFCPLPFTGLFYQNNSASSCCAMPIRPISPKDHFASEDTIKLQQDFINGQRPSDCRNCWIKERNGEKSIRNLVIEKSKSNYHSDPNPDLSRVTNLELRESNLCNFSCRMCNPGSSIVIDREIEANPELQKYFRDYDENNPTTKENWDQILELVKDLQLVLLTGGEPMLMKRYYDFLDHLISVGKQNVRLIIYTNGSVYNPIFVEKLKKFPNATLYFSIDAVGKVAEYQRRGTDWNIVRANILKYCELPITIKLHSTITAYSILGVSDLSDYFIELASVPRVATLMPFTLQIAKMPIALDITNLNFDLRMRAIDAIDTATQKLSDNEFFNLYIKELSIAQRQLKMSPINDANFQLFVDMTNALDKARGESFEEVFGYKLS